MKIAYVAVIIDNKVLLINNKGEKNDWWVLPGGEIEENTDIIEAAKQLFFDQTGYRVEITGIHKKYTLPEKSIFSLIGKLCGGKIKDGPIRENILWVPIGQLEVLDEKISFEAEILQQVVADCQKFNNLE